MYSRRRETPRMSRKVAADSSGRVGPRLFRLTFCLSICATSLSQPSPNPGRAGEQKPISAVPLLSCLPRLLLCRWLRKVSKPTHPTFFVCWSLLSPLFFQSHSPFLTTIVRLIFQLNAQHSKQHACLLHITHFLGWLLQMLHLCYSRLTAPSHNNTFVAALAVRLFSAVLALQGCYSKQALLLNSKLATLLAS